MGSEGVYDHNPRMAGIETASSFAVACMKHELKSTLAAIEKQEAQGYVDQQTLEWWFDPRTVSNGWLGKYYETSEAARASFDSVEPPIPFELGNVITYTGDEQKWQGHTFTKGHITTLDGKYKHELLQFANENRALFTLHSKKIHENDDFSYCCNFEWCRCCQ